MSEFDAKALADAVNGVKSGFEAFKEANDQRLKEIEAKGSADVLLSEKLDRITADMDAKQARLDQFELALKRQSRVVTDANGNAVDLDAKAARWANAIAREKGTRVEDFDAKGLDAYKSAFNTFLRKGDEIISADEKKALSVGTDADGGYVVHPDLNGAIITQVYETSPMRAFASIQTISTSSLEGIHDLDEAAAGWVGETDARAETATPQLAKWTINVHEIYANPRATQKILDDAEINMEAWLAGKVADKFARVESAAFVAGDGTGKPKGFLAYAGGTTNPGQIERFTTGVAGDFAADPNGADVLIDALYGLKAQYRANATWFMNRGTAKEVRKLKDSQGNYLWMPAVAAGQPATLLGYGVASFEDMPAMAAGSLSVAVGDMRSAYQIVDRVGIRTLRDPYSSKPYVQFYTTKRVGGDVVNFEALKLVEFSV